MSNGMKFNVNDYKSAKKKMSEHRVWIHARQADPPYVTSHGEPIGLIRRFMKAFDPQASSAGASPVPSRRTGSAVNGAARAKPPVLTTFTMHRGGDVRDPRGLGHSARGGSELKYDRAM